MKRTAKEEVKRGKHRSAHHKVTPFNVNVKNDKLAGGQKKSKPFRTSDSNLHQDDLAEKIPNGRLPPLVPSVRISPEKSNDIELQESEVDSQSKRGVDSQSGSKRLSNVVKDDMSPRATSPATRRRNNNMTSYEKMLQREKRRSRKISGSYAILHSVAEDHDLDSADDHLDALVVEDGTNISLSNTSLRSRRSSGTPSRQDPNQALLQYFAKLSSSVDLDDPLDFNYIQSLLHEGASVNTSDRFGQTLLHEVSRTWGLDVAQYFIDQGRSGY